MNNLQPTYINALLADASYVKTIKSGAIDAGIFKTRLTETQANFLAANFTVKTSVETDNTINPLLGTGFDAVVWEGKTGTPYAGQLYVSMRGTAGGTDIADDAILATKGLAYDQIRDMVNWWLKNTASTTDNNVVQIKVVDVPGAVIGRTFALGNPTTGTGVLSGLGPIAAVNGHSLGGYLSTVFTRLFGANVQAVNTYNSAGFSNVMSVNTQGELLSIANMIGASRGLGSLDAVTPKQTNYYAENGWEFTTNAWGEMGFLVPGFYQYGSRAALYQEDLISVDGLGMDNHSMYKLTDLLALGNALSQLDRNLSIAQLNALSKAGSNTPAASYESILDAVRRLLLGPNAAATPASDSAEGANRSTYHANLKALTETQAFKALATSGKVSFSVATSALASSAKTDFGAFLSLNALSPIVLSTGGDAAATAALQAAHPSLYADWNADKNARLYGDTTQQPAYSDHWYTDRAAMLQALVTRNEKDIGGIVPGSQNLLYQDVASNTEVLVGAGAAAISQRTMVRFGSAGAEPLEGGAGSDTYRLSGSFGKDKVVDADGLGCIEIDGQNLGVGKAGGQLNTWVAKLGDKVMELLVLDDSASATGKRLVVAPKGDSARKMRTSAMNDATWIAAA